MHSRAMRLQFLSKYREVGLLLLRVSLGLLFVYLNAPTLLSGPASWAHLGASHRGLHSHLQLWGFLEAFLASLGGLLMVFGLFFRIGVLMTFSLSLVHAIAVLKGSVGLHPALSALETCVVLFSLLFVGPGKFSVDKN
jgi:putative oxidoreductase